MHGKIREKKGKPNVIKEDKNETEYRITNKDILNI